MSIIQLNRKINKSYLPSIPNGPAPGFTRMQVVIGADPISTADPVNYYRLRATLKSAVNDVPPYYSNIRGWIYLPRGWRFVASDLNDAGYNDVATAWTFTNAISP